MYVSICNGIDNLIYYERYLYFYAFFCIDIYPLLLSIEIIVMQGVKDPYIVMLLTCFFLFISFFHVAG